jgi:hypothetical protein
MSDVYQSLTHSKWDCKYHVLFVCKRRRKAIFGQTRRQLGAIFHALARQKECQRAQLQSLACAGRSAILAASISGPGVMRCRPSGWSWSRYASTSASRKRRMEQLDNSELKDEARNARRLDPRPNRL